VEPILHLSLPVADLARARSFYLDVLGCAAGRTASRTADIWFFGLQLTLHEAPPEVEADQGVRHFGATLDRAHLDAICARVEERGVAWLRPPATRNAGTAFEESKAYLADPSGNVIELKAYADLDATLYAAGAAYR
jgi:extradiol dioxygenase family protein